MPVLDGGSHHEFDTSEPVAPEDLQALRDEGRRLAGEADEAPPARAAEAEDPLADATRALDDVEGLLGGWPAARDLVVKGASRGLASSGELAGAIRAVDQIRCDCDVALETAKEALAAAARVLDPEPVQ